MDATVPQRGSPHRAPADLLPPRAGCRRATLACAVRDWPKRLAFLWALDEPVATTCARRGPLSLVTERIWSLRVGAAGPRSDRDDRDPVLYPGIACCVELQEVNPRPGRTTMALGLRAVSDRPDVAHVGDGFDASSPVFGFGLAPGNFVGNGEQQLAYCASTFGDSRC